MDVRRPQLSWSQRNELWARWRRGESLVDIAALLQRHRTSIGDVVASAGGIAPPARRRSRLALTTTDREEISRGVAAGVAVRQIARQLGRAPSPISRELHRNGGRGGYRAQPALRQIVADKLARQWSPQQISGWLRVTFPGDADQQVSHETIYRSVFVQSRGALKRALVQHLRRQRAHRRARAASRVGHYQIGRAHV